MKLNNTILDVLPLEPIYKNKIWGGTRIARFRSIPHQKPQPVGESWEVSDIDDGCSRISAGQHKGLTLREMSQKYGPSLLGTIPKNNRFPLLIKMIDAEQDLSIQVHPGPKTVGSGDAPKEETWIILSASKGAKVLHGFAPNTTLKLFKEAIATGAPEPFLRSVSVHAGDILHVPPGTIHAICGGVFLLEVQQPSNSTYRVWDYNRPGLDGHPRLLHLEKAYRALNFDRSDDVLAAPRQLAAPSDIRLEQLMAAVSYRVERLSMEASTSTQIKLSSGSALSATIVQGNVTVSGQSEEHEFGLYSSFVIPASMESIKLRAHTESQIIVAGCEQTQLLQFLE
jgi:mannose-6-phosphate isomerase